MITHLIIPRLQMSWGLELRNTLQGWVWGMDAQGVEFRVLGCFTLSGHRDVFTPGVTGDIWGVTPGELRCSSRVEDVVGALNPKPRTLNPKP